MSRSRFPGAHVQVRDRRIEKQRGVEVCLGRWRSWSGARSFSLRSSRDTRERFPLGVLFAEPTGNVKPRIAGERYEGGKLVDVPWTKVVALDCATQGFPVPVTRYKRERNCPVLRLETRSSGFRGHEQDSSAILGQEIRKGSGFGC